MYNRFRNLFLSLPVLFCLASCENKGGDPGNTEPTPTPNYNIPTFNEPAIMFHYKRADNNYANWDMWLWEVNHDGAAFAFNGNDEWGAIAAYPLSTWVDPIANGLGFIVRKGGDTWAEKDLGGGDLFINFLDFDKDDHDVYHVYLVQGSSNVYSDTNGTIKGRIEYSSISNNNTIVTYATIPVKHISIKEDDTEIFSKEFSVPIKRVEAKLTDGKTIDIVKKYEVTVTFENNESTSIVATKASLMAKPEFGEAYNYDGELGAIYSQDSTTFKLWSPLSKKVLLRVYNDGTPGSLGGSDTYQEYEMVKGEKGVFSFTVSGDLNGKYYTYVVTNDHYTNRETIDPYAKSCGVNGLRGMVVDFEQTNPEGWDQIDYLNIDRKALTVYETHIADQTSSSTWTGTEANRKKFAGMYESGTTYTEGGITVKTGFDHIKELGVNAVQLVPIFDQANDELNMSFNWGYNPLNYNCLEGGYSSNPKDGFARIREFKQLVKSYNEAGIAIIMDVVYNHMSGAIGSNFDIVMPGYYFRYTSSLALANGSGCGNETKSENFMMRKFMIDSVNFWTREYKLGGFRFDLMGLHDLETMEKIVASAKEINPYITIYGEPWQGGTSPLAGGSAATQANGNKYVGYGAFNDKFRDAMIAGGLAADTDTGWVTNAKSSVGSATGSQLLEGIRGITKAGTSIKDPDKTINYVTCHDNFTLKDRAIATKLYTEDQDDLLTKMNVLANSVTFTSQGTTFMLAGEEMLRSKQGSKNSYNLSYEVNEIDYSLKVKHLQMMESYKKLIALKQNVDGLHLDKEQIGLFNPKFNNNYSLISYSVYDSVTGKNYYIYHANGLLQEQVIDCTGAELYLSTLEPNKVMDSNTKIKPYETLIIVK